MTDHLTSPILSGARFRRRLGEVLVQAGVLTEAQLHDALAHQALDGRRQRLGATVVQLGLSTEVQIAEALATQLGLNSVEEVPAVQPEASALVPAALMQRHEVVPIALRDDVLTVATADPTNVVALDDLRLASGIRRLRVVVTTPSALQRSLKRTCGFDQQAGQLIEAIDDHAEELDDDASVDDGPVVRLAEGILNEAMASRASDVHVEPGARELVVRYRIDGVLRTVTTIPRAKAGALVSRLKLIAGMDIAERRRPQDGRVAFRSQQQEVDLRVSSLPSLHGEKLVLRLLRKDGDRVSLEDIGFTPTQRAMALSMVEKPQGLVLITGPTGSGKTSSLYGFLGHLASQTTNIVTIEDPVEYELSGVNQTQVNDRIGLSFAKALRTVLRQDPDVIMVGEIRDPETAELAIQAALTGHLVFSTLHTNDAVGAIARLRDLGVAPYLIANALTLVMAQRLARRICQGCGGAAEVTEHTMSQLELGPDDLAGATLRAGAGCNECSQSGYLGRTALLELLPVDATVRELIAASAGETALRQAGRTAGLRSLREDGLAKAAAGITTLEEVLRTAPSPVGHDHSCQVCGQQVEDDFSVCPWCATKLRPGACPSCARSLERGWAVCPTCATPILQGARAPGSPGEGTALSFESWIQQIEPRR